MRVKVIKRPLIVESGEQHLAREIDAARYVHNQVLALHQQHQELLLQAEPERMRELRAELDSTEDKKAAKTLRAELKSLRVERDASPEWQAAKGWLREPMGVPKQARRKPGETDAELAARAATAQKTRFDVFRDALYEVVRRERWTMSYQAFPKAVERAEQAVSAVLKARASGKSARWHFRRWDESFTIAYQLVAGILHIERRDGPWWDLTLRSGHGVIRCSAKLGTWDDYPPDWAVTYALITRERRGCGWRYSLSLQCRGSWRELPVGSGMVAFDWGRRQVSDGLLAFTWVGSDGDSGRIVIPREVTELLEQCRGHLSRIDTVYAARKEEAKNRHIYRRELMRSGVRTEEQTAWLRWENKVQARADRCRRRAYALRDQLYLREAKALLARYGVFIFEKLDGQREKDLDTSDDVAMAERRDRDLTARYEFLARCKQLGAKVTLVSTRNSTRECPYCGALRPKTRDRDIACEACGKVADRDEGAARVLLDRATRG